MCEAVFDMFCLHCGRAPEPEEHYSVQASHNPPDGKEHFTLLVAEEELRLNGGFSLRTAAHIFFSDVL